MLDINAMRNPQVAMPKLVFDVIGISGLIPTWRHVEKLVPSFRTTFPRAKIVIGGGGFTSCPETYMTEIRPDFGVAGEGERTAVELLRVLQDGGDIHAVDGLWHWEDDQPRANKSRGVMRDLGELLPTWYGGLEMQSYVRGSKYFPWAGFSVLATRGCPFSCNFCYKIFGRGIRYRPVESVISELELLKSEYAVRGVLFGDECVTAKKDYILELCDLVRPLGMKSIMYSRLDTLDEEMARGMASAGVLSVGFGLESGSPEILSAMDKRLNLEEARETLLMASAVLPRASATVIFGYPGETDETLAETEAFLESLPRAIRGTLFCLTPYPGTRVFEDNKERIVSKFGDLPSFFRKLGDAGEFVVNLTDWSDDEYTERLVAARGYA